MKSLSHVQVFATPWTVAYQAPPSKEFSRQEYWSGVPSPSPYIYVCVYIYIYITMSDAKFQIFSDTKESVAGIQEEVAWLCTSVVWREGQRKGLGHGLGPD